MTHVDRSRALAAGGGMSLENSPSFLGFWLLSSEADGL